MANEAVLVERQPNTWATDFTVADGTAITKGSILMLNDPRTAILATNGPVPVAGIAARDKVASDGRTQLAVWTNPGLIFEVSLSGACNRGDPLMVAADATTYPNFLQAAGVTTSGANTIGFALVTGSTNERIQMRLQPGTAGGAIS